MTQALPSWTQAEPKKHPAKFSPQILGVIAAQVMEHHSAHTTVLDPMAGVGGIHELREMIGCDTLAVEIQPGWAVQSYEKGWTWCGDFLKLHPADHFLWKGRDQQRYTRGPEIIATSVTYGNRMGDHHEAKDDSDRMTYAHKLRAGEVREEIDPANTGMYQWTQTEYKLMHHNIHSKIIKMLPMGGLYILNVKDHPRGRVLQGVPEWHDNKITKIQHGIMQRLADVHVPVKGMNYGSNQTGEQSTKVGYEHVYVYRKEEAF